MDELNALRAACAGCTGCGLAATRHSVVFGVGQNKMLTMTINNVIVVTVSKNIADG